MCNYFHSYHPCCQRISPPFNPPTPTEPCPLYLSRLANYTAFFGTITSSTAFGLPGSTVPPSPTFTSPGVLASPLKPSPALQTDPQPQPELQPQQELQPQSSISYPLLPTRPAPPSPCKRGFNNTISVLSPSYKEKPCGLCGCTDVTKGRELDQRAAMRRMGLGELGFECASFGVAMWECWWDLVEEIYGDNQGGDGEGGVEATGKRREEDRKARKEREEKEGRRSGRRRFRGRRRAERDIGRDDLGGDEEGKSPQMPLGQEKADDLDKMRHEDTQRGLAETEEPRGREVQRMTAISRDPDPREQGKYRVVHLNSLQTPQTGYLATDDDGDYIMVRGAKESDVGSSPAADNSASPSQRLMEDIHGVELAAVVDYDRSAETSHPSSSQERSVPGPESSRMRRRSQSVRRSDRAVIHHSLPAQPTASECPSGQPLAVSEDVEMRGTQHSNRRQGNGNSTDDASTLQALNAASAALSDLLSEGIDMSGTGSYRRQQIINGESANGNDLAGVMSNHPAAPAPLATAVRRRLNSMEETIDSPRKHSQNARMGAMSQFRQAGSSSGSVNEASKSYISSQPSSTSGPGPSATPNLTPELTRAPSQNVRMGGMRDSRRGTGSRPIGNCSSAPASPAALSPIHAASTPSVLQTSQDVQMSGTTSSRHSIIGAQLEGHTSPFQLLTEPLPSLSSTSTFMRTPSTAPPFASPSNIERPCTAPPTTTTFSQDVSHGRHALLSPTHKTHDRDPNRAGIPDPTNGLKATSNSEPVTTPKPDIASTLTSRVMQRSAGSNAGVKET
ncbi:hypothetical protein B9Z65_2093 [Elsinoe australis]|uniref:Uncharacterized protein n=1 Tax=Elsinoe australis TaxID=40998 RepID=A0A2P7YN11_9PEZI|nr:hypothetical protein B9Z65_2093 [Elsinoe australis]